jgi:acyl carrier protein
MPGVDGLEVEIKALIVEVLNLEHVTAADIETGAPLFGEGLGLDSIDSLDLSMAVQERYGVRFDADPASNARHFASVTTLAAFVATRRTR